MWSVTVVCNVVSCDFPYNDVLLQVLLITSGKLLVSQRLKTELQGEILRSLEKLGVTVVTGMFAIFISLLCSVPSHDKL